MLLSSPKDYHAAARTMREAQSDGSLTLLFVAPNQATAVAQILEELGLPSSPIGQVIAATEGSPLLELRT